jgi:hypothetical protein
MHMHRPCTGLLLPLIAFKGLLYGRLRLFRVSDWCLQCTTLSAMTPAVTTAKESCYSVLVKAVIIDTGRLEHEAEER